MKDCRKFEDSIRSMIAGDAELEQMEGLVEHCKSCADCRSLFETHRTLSHLGSRFDSVEPVDLSQIRMSIVEKAIAKRRRLMPDWTSLLKTRVILRPLAAAALLVVVFLLGFAASRLSDRIPPSGGNSLTDISAVVGLQDLERSPFSYSNVSVRLLGNDKVALSFDITRRVEVIEPARSELVKKILVQSLFDPAPTGAVGHFPPEPPRQKFIY